jgi:hypothetical protein
MCHVGEDLSEKKSRHLDGLDHMRTSAVRVPFKEHCSDFTISWTNPERNYELTSLKAVYVGTIISSTTINTPWCNKRAESNEPSSSVEQSDMVDL